MIAPSPAAARVLFPLPAALTVSGLTLLVPPAHAVRAPAAQAQSPPPAWRWPLPGAPEVVRGFDPPALPWGSGHRGVDLGARAGDPVYAAGPGRAGYVGRIAGQGIVTIVHDGRRTTYLPVRASVRRGDRVRPGAKIGTVEPGFAHCAVRVCLHWGLIRGKTYLDPLSLLPRVPIRLLPYGGTPLFVPLAARAGGTGAARPPERVRIRPASDLAQSAAAGSGGAGLVLLILSAAGRKPWRRRAALHYHPAGGRKNEPQPHPAGRHRRTRLLPRLRARRRPPSQPAPATEYAEVIDLATERRLRRPTQSNERDPA